MSILTGRSAVPESGQPAHGIAKELQVLDFVCFSHLRWDFVYQRPQHLLSRAARQHRVYYFEEPVRDAELPWLELSTETGGVQRAVPHVPARLSDPMLQSVLRSLVDVMVADEHITEFVAWYYTPLALKFTAHLEPVLTVYDCMDELSQFKGASRELPGQEKALFAKADLVFTGGNSLYQAKRHQHASVHAFPSSIDHAHFSTARSKDLPEPADQAQLPEPRLGFFGVIDERFDTRLLEQLATARPDWQFIMIGPVVKIDPAILPVQSNIHWLGSRSYQELPAYLAYWDAAIMPFALNDATRFISPTKTLEFLAAAKPVVSTAITDVVTPYGGEGLVGIAHNAEEFLSECEAALAQPDRSSWLHTVDRHLSTTSWESTWQEMTDKLETALLQDAAPTGNK